MQPDDVPSLAHDEGPSAGTKKGAASLIGGESTASVQAPPSPAFLSAMGLAPESSGNDLEKLCATVAAILASDDPTRGNENERKQFWKEKLSAGASSPWPPLLRAASSPVANSPTTRQNKLTARPADLVSFGPADFWIAVWGLLLARYTGESLVIFGVPEVYDFSGPENIPMRLAVTLPLVVAYDEKQSFHEWMKIVGRARQDLRRGGPASLESIARWAGLAPSALFFESQIALDLEVTDGGHSYEMAEHRPPVTLRLSADGMDPTLEWDPARFDSCAAKRLAGHLETLSEFAGKNPGEICGRLPLLTAGEWQKMVVDWNSTRVAYDADRGIHGLIEAQAARTPDAIAVSCDGLDLSYRELDQRADALARRLVAGGVTPNMLVPICVSRSLNMIVGIVAILKAGGAYAPLDLNYPADWLAFAIQDVAAPLLVTESALAEKLPGHGATLIFIDDDAVAPCGEVLPKGQPDHLAYAIYTSGSTGKPKGVLVSHRNLASSIAARIAFYGGGHTHFLLLPSYAFDTSVTGIFWMLTTGGRLSLVPEEAQQDLTKIDHLLTGQGITTFLCQPTFYLMLLERWQTSSPSTLRGVIVGGEVCLPKMVAQHQRQVPQATLYNEYGPTEGTVWSTVQRCDAPDYGASVPVGRVIPNARIYLLNSHFQPVPMGVAGEICIGGEGVAQGYLNRPELTAERFVSNPFQPGERLYLTGDYARYLPDRNDGTLEFLGRRDQQVKVRGFRVELGEIETVLAHAPGVNECVVLAREDQPGDQRLVAYVTLLPGAAFSVSDLRHFVRLRLPEYMVPMAVVRMESFPLTGTGKIDRRNLPAPDPASAPSSATFLAPGNALEEQIAGIWKKELKLAVVGIEDNFFDIGGHSLSLVRVHQQLQKTLAREIPITELFQFPTIRSLAVRLGQEPDETGLGDKVQARAQRQRAALARNRRPMSS